jgi:hypothetical protein
MKAFVFWLDRPFDPRRGSRTMRRPGRCVTIRYSGSFGRTAVKALIVLALLATMSSIIGERTVQDLDAGEAAHGVGAVVPGR